MSIDPNFIPDLRFAESVRDRRLELAESRRQIVACRSREHKNIWQRMVAFLRGAPTEQEEPAEAVTSPQLRELKRIRQY